MKKNWLLLWFIFYSMFGVFFLHVFSKDISVVRAEDLVIVIDPGHGGENLGAEWNGYTEKDMTLIISKAMKQELEKYEGVTVYLTHDTDVDMSLQERCDFAYEKQADFLFCLHLNMHETHDVYGSEVWIPSKGANYVKGYQFADIVLNELKQKGLYIRGIKTRLNEKGKEYYGIIRHSEEYGFPCALVEHCHLDHERDVDFYESVHDLEELGKTDALAVAKYFGLSSKKLGVDYSGFKLVSVEAPSISIPQDLSPADYVELEINEVSEAKGTISCSLEADDYDSYILYYSYSYDGGNTYSPLYPYDRKNSVHFTMNVPYSQTLDVVARVYNKYDQIAESKIITISALKDPNVTDEEQELEKEESLETTISISLEENETSSSYETSVSSNHLEHKNKASVQKIIKVAIAIFLISIGSVFISAIISFQMVKKSNKK